MNNLNYNYITDPRSGKKIKTRSPKGRKLIKRYLKNYRQHGGMGQPVPAPPNPPVPTPTPLPFANLPLAKSPETVEKEKKMIQEQKTKNDGEMSSFQTEKVSKENELKSLNDKLTQMDRDAEAEKKQFGEIKIKMGEDRKVIVQSIKKLSNEIKELEEKKKIINQKRVEKDKEVTLTNKRLNDLQARQEQEPNNENMIQIENEQKKFNEIEDVIIKMNTDLFN